MAGRLMADMESVYAGLSNMVTACVGAGLTGSYIFSQTVFSLRGGVTSRLQGFVISGHHLGSLQQV